MDDVFTFRDTGYVAEHYFQRPGEPTRYYRKGYIRGVERRMKRRGDTLTDDQGARRDGGPVLRVVRAARHCQACGDGFEPTRWNPQSTRCPSCAGKHARAAKGGAR